MHRRALVLLVAATAALGCEILVSTSHFDDPLVPDDAALDAPPDHADASPPPPCDCPAPRVCAANAAKYATDHGCTIAAPDAGAGGLLACSAGVWSVATACNSGCATNAAAGVDQCICACFAGPGDYCGFEVLDAGAGSDCFVASAQGHAQDLVTCAGNKDGGVWSFKINCPNGCMYNAGGSDTCK